MFRFYSLQDDVLSMQTQIDSEFGPVVLWTYAHLHNPDIRQVCTDRETECISVDVRIAEMYHFLSVFKLFDPQVNTKPDGLSSFVSSAPPEPWEKE